MRRVCFLHQCIDMKNEEVEICGELDPQTIVMKGKLMLM